jgi:hypothetical protein
MSAAGGRNPRRKHFEVPSVIVVRPAALEVLKVCITHDPHIALVRALNDDNIASVEIFTAWTKRINRLLSLGPTLTIWRDSGLLLLRCPKPAISPSDMQDRGAPLQGWSPTHLRFTPDKPRQG